MKPLRPTLFLALFATALGAASCGGKSERHGGTQGDAGQAGETSGYSVSLLTQEAFSKVDLLFVVDNSISMADKQRIFAEAMPVLLKRLMTPLCIDIDGNPTGEFSPCPVGAGEFAPMDDIHVGIITSSLGNHGGDVCTPDPNDVLPRPLNDRAELLPAVRDGLYSFEGAGFLVWDPRNPRPLPDPQPSVSDHESNPDEFLLDFATEVEATGETGCGYEGSLEAWYRFLVDPEPIAEVSNDGESSVRGPVNQVVLAQRAKFLRPDSLLLIVMLTDENDCSITDEPGSNGWLTGRRVPMARGSSECDRVGDDAERCCRLCTTEVEGCPANESDTECMKGVELSSLEDSTNLRCFQQVRRFGLDLLYPWQRYVDALTSPRIGARAPAPEGRTEVNPIFAPGADGTPSPLGRAFLVGILGVPWQDLADETSLDGRELTYLDANGMRNTLPSRWDVILGDPDTYTLPLDPFMIESIDPRTGRNPITSESPLPPTVTGQGNAINGHEQNVTNRDDLQYACTFDLVPDVPCSMANQDACDCNLSEVSYNRSICEYDDTNTDGTQTHAKAYPGLRQLRVLKGLENNGIVASICPKNTVPDGEPSTDPAYGYNPAVTAMVRRFKDYLTERCLWKPFQLDSSGRIPCSVVEVTLSENAPCSCDPGTGRFALERGTPLARAVPAELDGFAWCGEDTSIACSDYCACEVLQFSADALATCRNSLEDTGDLYGFCYVDAETSNPDLVAACPPGERQNLRFMGRPAAKNPSATLIFCPDS